MKKYKVDLVLLFDEVPTREELIRELRHTQILDDDFFEGNSDNPDPHAIRGVAFDWQSLRLVEEADWNKVSMPSGLIDSGFFDRKVDEREVPEAVKRITRLCEEMRRSMGESEQG
jgi:hypothetical protein